MAVSIKICGLTDEAAMRAVTAAQAEYAGFVYYPMSPRHITLHKAAKLKSMLPASTKTVSVVVDPEDALITQVARTLAPDYIQLHGKETPARINTIRSLYPNVKLIKAISVRTADDVAQARAYIPHVDALLFDAKPPKLPGMLPGGNGLSFDWQLLKNHDFSLPWFLSGGLNGENVTEAVRESGAPMVDISSGVESAPGVKDPALIEAFVKQVRSI